MFLKEMDSGHLYTELTSLTNVDEAYPTLPINAGQWHARLGHLHPRRIENFPSDAEQIPADAECPAYIFFLNGGPISWASYLQTTVALSTVESEVMALTEAIKEAIYIRRLLESLGAAQEGPTIIYTDSTGAEALVDHPTSHGRTKHIEIRREFIKFHIGHETVKIERVSTKDRLADIMTKPRGKTSTITSCK
ncbi:RNA-dependent DNA polymerase [Pseudoscourfieldia marina]